MDFLPIFLNIRDKKCVVVGGGGVAYRKASLLLQAGAKLHLVTESISEDLKDLAESHGAVILLQRFTPQCLQNASLVVAATQADL